MLTLTEFFADFLQKNITVSVVMIAVLTVRMLFKEFPKKYSFVLWAFVGIRMVFDISISSGISLFTFLGAASAWVSRVLSGRLADSTVAESGKPLSGNAISGNFPSGNAGDVLAVGGGTIANGMTTGNGLPFVAGQNDFPTAGSFIPDGQGAMDAGDALQSANSLADEIGMSLGVEKHIAMVMMGLAVIWIVGMIAILYYGIFSYIKYRNAVVQAVRFRDNIWECDRISSPFVLGIFVPRIYIPFQIEEDERKYILAHEQYHIRRRDYVTKLLAFCLLTIYWMNPLAWVAFYLMSRDMEMSCDEAVLEKFGEGIKKAYSLSLLNAAEERRLYSFAPIAFGEADAGKRIKNVLKFKKPKAWMTVLVILIIGGVGIACLTNSAGGDEQPGENVAEDAGNDIDTDFGNDAGNDIGESVSDAGSDEYEESSISRDNTASGNVSADDVQTDDTKTDNVVFETSDIDPALYEVYMEAVMRLVNEKIFPNGQTAEPEESYGPNMYKIADVDGDGRAELIINYPNTTYTAAMAYYIFDYDANTGEFYEELAVYPSVTIYDNGVILMEASHNHGRSGMDDFWPYYVYQYQKDTDTYEYITWVDAWEYIMFDGAEPDETFPKEADADGDGVVYYCMGEGGYYEPDVIMDNAEYAQWLNNLTAGATPIQIDYENLPEADAKNLIELDRLDMDGNGKYDRVVITTQKDGEMFWNVVTVQLDDGTMKEMKYPGYNIGREDGIAVDTGKVHFKDRDSVVIALTDTASNYGGTETYVLSVTGQGAEAELIEDVKIVGKGTVAPQEVVYKDGVLEIAASLSLNWTDDLVKVDALLGTVVQVSEYDSVSDLDGRKFYVYWNGERWDAVARGEKK